jgi:hypothetical protein
MPGPCEEVHVETSGFPAAGPASVPVYLIGTASGFDPPTTWADLPVGATQLRHTYQWIVQPDFVHDPIFTNRVTFQINFVNASGDWVNPVSGVFVYVNLASQPWSVTASVPVTAAGYTLYWYRNDTGWNTPGVFTGDLEIFCDSIGSYGAGGLSVCGGAIAVAVSRARSYAQVIG